MGLKKSASVFFAGEADGLAAGEAAAAVFAFRPRLVVAEGEASVPAAGEVLLAGDALLVAAVFLDTRCFFAGEGDSAGDPPGVGD